TAAGHGALPAVGLVGPQVDAGTITLRTPTIARALPALTRLTDTAASPAATTMPRVTRRIDAPSIAQGLTRQATTLSSGTRLTDGTRGATSAAVSRVVQRVDAAVV